MATRPGVAKHGDCARGGETLPRERLGSFADGQETGATTSARAGSPRAWRPTRATGSRRPSTWPPAAGAGLN